MVLQIASDGVADPTILPSEPEVPMAYFAPNRRVAVGTRVGTPSRGVDGTTYTWSNSRFKHYAKEAITDIQLFFTNTKIDNTSETNGANDITVKAAIEYPQDIFYRLKFGGQDSITIPPGITVGTDPLPIDLVGWFYSRSNVSVASAGMTWPVGRATQIRLGEGRVRGTGSNVDLTMSTYGQGMTFSYSAAFAPIQIVGRTAGSTPSVLILGNSTAEYVGDDSGNGYLGDEDGNFGYLERALAQNCFWHNMAKAANTAKAMNTLANRMTRSALWQDRFTHAIVELGTNDVPNETSLAALQDIYGPLWTSLAARGMKVFQCTITPRTSGDYSSEEGQIPLAGKWTPGGLGHQLNDWFRSGPALLSGVFEIADLAMTDRNSGIWKPGHTTDGVHPDPTLSSLLALGIDPARLVLAA